MLCLAAAFAAPWSHAAPITSSWKGTSGSTWSTAGNWTNGVPSTLDYQATFDSNFTGSSNPNITAATTIGEIVGAASLAKAVTITTGTNTLTLNGVGTTVLDWQSNSKLTLSGKVALAGGDKVINVGNGASDIDVEISAALSNAYNATLTKTGAGTLKLSGNNTFVGPIVISQGVVIAASNTALGTDPNEYNNKVLSGAALHLTGGVTIAEANFYLSGSGPDGLGALRSLSGNNTYQGSLTLSGDTTIGIASGANLTLSDFNYGRQISTGGYNLTLKADGNAVISTTQISGGGVLTKLGSGTVRFDPGIGSNQFSPTSMNVQEGIVELNRKFNAGDKSNAISIGTTSGPAATLRMISSNNLTEQGSQTVNIHESGTLDLNNQNDGIASLRLWGGNVQTGTGTLSINNSSGDEIHAYVSNQTATISGKLHSDLGGQPITINVEEGPQATDLNISAAMSGSVVNWIKNGDGLLEYSGTAANTFTGGTIVNAGTLRLNKTDGVDAISGSSITVNTGGTLLLDSNDQIKDSTTLTLNGGTLNTGEPNGYNEKLGTLTLSSSSTIDLGSGLHLLEFADSHSQTWNGTLTIYDWVGPAGGPGTEGRIFVGTNTSGLTSSQLAQVTFDGFAPGAILLSNGELVPFAAIPEAKTVIAASVLLLAIGWKERKRLSALAKTLHRRAA